MITIRNGVFETNSSSEHCVTLLKPPEYEEFLNGKSFLIVKELFVSVLKKAILLVSLQNLYLIMLAVLLRVLIC